MKGQRPVSLSAGLLFSYPKKWEQKLETTSSHYSRASNAIIQQEKVTITNKIIIIIIPQFFLLHSYSKVIKRQLDEAILLDWTQGRGVLKLGRRVFRVNRNVLNSKFEHWRPKPVFKVGR